MSGVVLVDPGSQYLQAACRRTSGRSGWRTSPRPVRRTRERGPRLSGEHRRARGDAGLPAGIPVVVLSADRPFDYLGIGDADAYWPNWLEAASLLAASFAAPHVTETASGHFVANENPALVIDQICAMVPGC